MFSALTKTLASVVLTGVLGGSFVAACHEPEPESPSVGLTKPVHPPKNPDLGRGAPRTEIELVYNIWIGDPVREVCKGPSPIFQFDSAKVGPTDQPTMQVLSDCMAEGPLKGKSIRLIGHTDPRGSVQYNDKLGLERAERVKRYLVVRGIEPARVSVQTAGKDAASPYPADWPRERRVEIQLAN